MTGTEAAIQIDRIDAETIDVPIIGTSPLIMHNWSTKAKRIMLEAQQGRKTPKEKRDPEGEFTSALYRIGNDRYGFPAIAFKAATIGGARFYGKSVTMTSLRQCLFFKGILTDADPQSLVEIHGEPKMREDMVRVGMGSADLRYRPEFVGWSATLRITYVRSMVDRQSVLSLVDAGGMGVGIGEWRPEKKGDFGCYAVDQDKTIEVVS